MEQLLSKSAPVALSYLPLAPKRAGRPPIFFSFFYSSMIIGSMCAISDFLLLNEKTVEWCERTLRQSFGQNSIFFNNAQNELTFDSKHCFCDLNIKMTHYHILTMRLLWKLKKIAAKMVSRGKIIWPQL